MAGELSLCQATSAAWQERGVEQVVELPLDGPTKAALHRSADAVRELVEAMARIKAEAPA